MHHEALQRAINLCGGQAALAAKIGRTQQCVSFWLHQAKNLRVEAAIEIERATDGVVKRAELRPDVFGDAA